MERRVIIKSSVNAPPEKEVNDAIFSLGEGWEVLSATTTVTVFGVGSGQLPPPHHAVYVTTVVVEEP